MREADLSKLAIGSSPASNFKTVIKSVVTVKLITIITEIINITISHIELDLLLQLVDLAFVNKLTYIILYAY